MEKRLREEGTLSKKPLKLSFQKKITKKDAPEIYGRALKKFLI